MPLDGLRSKGGEIKASSVKPDAAEKEFALAGALSMMQIAGIVAVIGLGGVVMIGALYVAGTIDTVDVLAAAVFSLPVAAGIARTFLAFGRGTVVLTPDRMELRAKLGKSLYKWSHIDSIELVQPPAARVQLMTLSNAPHDRPTVRIRLARSLRLGLMARYGTDIFGIPSLIAKTVLLKVEDPEGFVREAHFYLHSTQR